MYDSIYLAEVVGNDSGKVFARRDWDGCPEKNTCTMKGYIINGDKVLAANPTEGWVCIYYYGKKSDYVGWVRQSEIKEVRALENIKIDEWAGKWNSMGGVDLIDIRQEKSGIMQVEGRSTWHGGENAFGDEVVNLGHARGTMRLNGNTAVVRDGNEKYSCILNMKLIGSFLVVTDNELCGGTNVRFNGVYKREP